MPPAAQPIDAPLDSAPLRDLVLRNWRGADVRLGDLWSEHAVLLAFMRHYGCTFCRDQAVGLSGVASDLERAGAPLTLIGQGTPGNAAAFRERFGLDVDLLADTDRLAYRAVGARRVGAGKLIGPRMLARGAARMLRSGVVQGRTVGHPAQLGGLLLVRPSGEVAWSHLSGDASDYPPAEEVLERVAGAV